MSDRPLNERVREQAIDSPMSGRGYFATGRQVDEIAALKAERDRLAWMWEIAGNLDPTLVDGVERQWKEEGNDD